MVLMFYVKPEKDLIGKIVQRGDKVAVQQDMSVDYGDHITDHVHLALKVNNKKVNPSKEYIPYENIA